MTPRPIAMRYVQLTDEPEALVRSVRLPGPQVPQGAAIEVFAEGRWTACVVVRTDTPTLLVRRL